MDFLSMLAIVLSHIAAPLYMGRRKNNKAVTMYCWLGYAFFSLCILFLVEEIHIAFFELLLMQLLVFFITADGPAGEKLFLFLTYANAFCICTGARLYLLTVVEASTWMRVCEIGLFLLTHLFLYKVLLPVYNKARVFFLTGWWRLNAILFLFFVQFLNRYAFAVADVQSARETVFDFLIFCALFYLTVMFLFGAIKDNAEMHKKTIENDALKTVAYEDTLTHIQNRAAYTKYTKRQSLAHRNNKNGSFISVVMDIDGFKSINDTNGHAAGDKILKAVGEILSKHFSAFQCALFRFGGDEFVLLTEQLRISDMAAQIKALNDKLLAEVGVAVSYGCAAVSFYDDKPFEVAFKKADELMYVNKLKRKAVTP